MNFTSYKEAYLYGFKDGISVGVEKGIEIAESWCEDCPPANSAPVMESISYDNAVNAEESKS